MEGIGWIIYAVAVSTFCAAWAAFMSVLGLNKRVRQLEADRRR